MAVLDFSKARSGITVVGEWEGEAIVKKFNYIPSSKGSAKPAYRIDYVLDNGDEFDGTPVFQGGSLQEEYLWSAKEAFVGCGCDPDMLASQIDTDAIAREIVGQRVILTIMPENYEDQRERDADGRPTEKTRNRVDKVTPA